MSSPLLVRDLMTVGVPTCKWNTPLTDIARFLIENNVEALCVLDSEGHAIGFIGPEELIIAYTKDTYKSLNAEDFMSEGVPELQAEFPLTTAAKIMHDKGNRIAYLLHNSGGIIYPAAFLSYRHILRHMAAKDEEELKDLGLEAARKSPVQIFIERRDAARKKAGLG